MFNFIILTIAIALVKINPIYRDFSLIIKTTLAIIIASYDETVFKNENNT